LRVVRRNEMLYLLVRHGTHSAPRITSVSFSCSSNL
jgi:hypothetical protein